MSDASLAVLVDQFLTPERQARLQSVASQRQLDVSVVCENVDDPHNISAIIRSCDGFGIQQVEVVGESTRFRAHAKSSASAREWVDVRPWTSLEECFAQLHEEGKTIYVSQLDPAAKNIYEIDWTQPCALVLGNEHAGVTEEIARLGDQTVYIPMSGMVQSFNVSVAGAIMLSELSRQRHEAGLYEPWRSPQQEELLHRWLERELEEVFHQ